MKTIYGNVKAMVGDKLFVNTSTDEIVTIVVKDKKERWDLYCSSVKITIEKISPKQLLSDLWS